MVFFSLVSFVMASDSLNERVRSVLVEEIGQRLEMLSLSHPEMSVKVESTGLNLSNRCQEPYDISVHFSSREDFQGQVKAKLSMNDANGVCGNFQIYPRLAISGISHLSRHLLHTRLLMHFMEKSFFAQSKFIGGVLEMLGQVPKHTLGVTCNWE